MPTLGRLPAPEDLTKTARADKSKAQQELPSGAETKDIALTDPTALAQAPDAVTEDLEATSAFGPPEPAHAEENIPDQASTELERDWTEQDARLERSLSIDELSDEGPDSVDEEASKTAADAMNASRILADAEPPTDLETLADLDILKDDASETPFIPPASVEVDAAVAEPDEQIEASSSRPLLKLDWDRLIDEGFVDPRDRSRPLPKNMDDIARALIRQSLSDQSSWRDRIILVTSPNERISKTEASINFAFGLTTVNRHRVVLVDADTSGPGAVDRLDGNSLVGIVTALADEDIEIGDLAIRTDLDRLILVASGEPNGDMLDRFASRRMLQILRFLTEDPDTLLIIDAPPILVSQEAAVLSVIAGQVVLAVEAGRTSADSIDHALQRIGDRHNVSLVLNENSGIGSEHPQSLTTSAGHEQVSSNRRAHGMKRRLPKAAAAGILAFGLLALQPAGHSDVAGELLANTAVLPPDRWPTATKMTTAMPYGFVW